MRIDDLEAGSAARRRAQGLRRNVEITDAAILLGAGILLAGLSLDGAEPRLLALLAAAFGCAASPRILDVMQKATGLWKGGEKFRAQLHLTYARLPPLTEEQAFALCAALPRRLRVLLEPESISPRRSHGMTASEFCRKSLQRRLLVEHVWIASGAWEARHLRVRFRTDIRKHLPRGYQRGRNDR